MRTVADHLQAFALNVDLRSSRRDNLEATAPQRVDIDGASVGIDMGEAYPSRFRRKLVHGAVVLAEDENLRLAV